MATTGLALATLADWAGVMGVAVAIIGLALVVVQLHGATAASRAQATIQFQAAFLRSQPARGRLQSSFPVHVSMLEQLVPPERRSEFQTWKDVKDLTDEEVQDARTVIGAMNDVAQYVVDGLALRSALQQYHTVFIRAGVLLLPYLDLENASVEGRPQARYGYRMVDLYNAGISYHRSHWKHQGRELSLKRMAADGSKKVSLILLDTNGEGVQEHPGFGDESKSTGYEKWKLRRTVRRAENRLRR